VVVHAALGPAEVSPAVVDEPAAPPGHVHAWPFNVPLVFAHCAAMHCNSPLSLAAALFELHWEALVVFAPISFFSHLRVIDWQTAAEVQHKPLSHCELSAQVAPSTMPTHAFAVQVDELQLMPKVQEAWEATSLLLETHAPCSHRPLAQTLPSLHETPSALPTQTKAEPLELQMPDAQLMPRLQTAGEATLLLNLWHVKAPLVSHMPLAHFAWLSAAVPGAVQTQFEPLLMPQLARFAPLAPAMHALEVLGTVPDAASVTLWPPRPTIPPAPAHLPLHCLPKAMPRHSPEDAPLE